jgi:hypothetical protein
MMTEKQREYAEKLEQAADCAKKTPEELLDMVCGEAMREETTERKCPEMLKPYGWTDELFELWIENAPLMGHLFGFKGPC